MHTLKQRKLICVGFSIIITLVVLFIQMRIWEFDFTVLPATAGDSFINLISLKSMKEFGIMGFWFNYRLGAPDMSSLIDTPFLDYPIAVMGCFLVHIFSSEIVAFYVLYILAFALAALTMSLLISSVSENILVNIIFSSIFALLPYHFTRGVGHLTLTFYYVIPIGIYLGLLVYENSFVKGLPEKWHKSVWKYIGIYALCFLVGISNVYYSYFSMIMVMIAILMKSIEEKSIKVFLSRISVFIGMAAGFFAGILPKTIYSTINGKNLVAGIRYPAETEVYGLKLIQLFLPPVNTRVDILRNIQIKYTTGGFNINENFTSSLGVAGIIGFIVLCVFLLLRLIIPNEKMIRDNRRLGILSIWTLVLILYCTVGGFGAIFSYLVTPELRGLNRVSVVLDALAILGVVIVISKFGKKLIWVSAIVLFAITIYVDIPQAVASGSQDSMKAACAVYKDFFGKVESSLPSDSMIYELPMVEFPESPAVNHMEDYALFRGYLFTDKLKWSYGGMKGRNTAAKDIFVDDGMSIAFIKGLVANKFSGVYIDTDAYEDSGAAINKFYQDTLKLKPIVSKDGKLYFYSIEKIDDTLLTD